MVDGAELLERGGGLQGENAAGEEAGEDDDGHGTDADGVHLGVDVGPIAGTGKEVRDRRASTGWSNPGWRRCVCLAKISGETKGMCYVAQIIRCADAALEIACL